MCARRFFEIVIVLSVAALSFFVQPVQAQQGKLYVQASPPEAYLFVDGKAVHESNRYLIKLPVGEHQVGIYNYGFQPVTQNVTISAGKTSKLKVALDPVRQTTSKPWGAMTIEGPRSAAVLLNGKTPDYFVGHVDEFNHEWWWKQELIVPPGMHQVTIEEGDKVIWSGAVAVPANQRVVIDAHSGRIVKTVPWPRGDKLGNRPRFQAGAASTTVAVAPVTAQLNAGPTPVDCGTPSRLTWSSSGDVHNEINGVGDVTSSGTQSVQPKQTTTYMYTASGPGGTATSSATVVVNPSIQAALQATPAEVRYHRLDDRVEEQPNYTLSWSASNADSVSITTIGTVGSTGSRSVRAVPQKTDPGAVDETLTYSLTATNSCGTSETRTATVHLLGSIDKSESKLSLNSVYFPTNYPTTKDPQTGLVTSQQRILEGLANDFKKYLETNPQAHLLLNAHADERGPTTFNQVLSERRAERVRSFLTEHGVPESNIETQASGDQNNLGTDEVKNLETENPKLPSDERQKVLVDDLQTTVLANNRRVDLAIDANGQQSLRYFPHDAADAGVLWNRSEPSTTEAVPQGDH
jgi:outer membrane protein OmpA-like peptidoglycan-associated protein